MYIFLVMVAPPPKKVLHHIIPEIPSSPSQNPIIIHPAIFDPLLDQVPPKTRTSHFRNNHIVSIMETYIPRHLLYIYSRNPFLSFTESPNTHSESHRMYHSSYAWSLITCHEDLWSLIIDPLKFFSHPPPIPPRDNNNSSHNITGEIVPQQNGDEDEVKNYRGAGHHHQLQRNTDSFSSSSRPSECPTFFFILRRDPNQRRT